MPAVVDKAKDTAHEVRTRWPILDHALRMNTHYGKVRGGALAGAVTYFGFLSFFPLIALAFSVVGFIADAYPDAQNSIQETLQDTFPSLIGTGEGQINVETFANAKAGAGLVGLVGLLYAGLGWLDALREALRQVWGLTTGGGNFVVKKVMDVVVLVVFGTLVLATTTVSSFTTSLSGTVLGWFDLDGNVGAAVLLRVLGVTIAVIGNTAVLLFVFTRLPGHRLPWRNTWHGALLGGIGIEVLKQLGTTLIGNTTSNPLYASFAVVVGLLVWINFISRVILYAASWAATGPKATLEALTVAEADVLSEEEAKVISGKPLPQAIAARDKLRARNERRDREAAALVSGRRALPAGLRKRAAAFLGVVALVSLRSRQRTG
ncbi:YihY/virulence factor BrkB family protein [Motilibacter aurantiacus]|uniref:YihY/virulence factor BrkB family protein n=1 Tax=Motilibacter aurantiacus TaxID=2714955 RepID=UPI00140CDC3B|nr:YihY/virulence factor BrkB family protein [Motilibacter aurantiacus]NHC43934.1 YihY/virulence factor BrkB family protein [Motilibacter aurantiacus]